MANAQIQRKLAQISSDLGYVLPIICTPCQHPALKRRGFMPLIWIADQP
ncbi:hypothetical protein PL8927_620021 [Planktothrix serta PCC 8927]|uniref:Uncharacterized protein n=1 Tax=Planktothrix serta PCC 8927 TaxID=671068 RepID=A0A7Z9BR91_9CYAN|nr:hypothetical protein PL8927_620021 [Planktothrix serta PCC 8927]